MGENQTPDLAWPQNRKSPQLQNRCHFEGPGQDKGPDSKIGRPSEFWAPIWAPVAMWWAMILSVLFTVGVSPPMGPVLRFPIVTNPSPNGRL